jgi:putative molybdopterin biosynthesis protein
MSQAELAKRCGISRQALGAIEAGLYQPGVMVAVNLARELGETVESLFADNRGHECREIDAAWMGKELTPIDIGRCRVALARIGGKLVAVPQPVASLALLPASGTVERLKGKYAAVQTFRSSAEIDATLLLAGCDPSAAILMDWMARNGSRVGVVTMPCSSGKSLTALADGSVHAAGVHLRDPNGGDYNLEPVRRAVGRRRIVLFNFASWEVGLVTAKEGSHKLSQFAEIARPDVKIINREKGSGARQALDEALKEAGLSPEQIKGYDSEVRGHLEVAAAVASGQGEAGVTIRVAAEAYGLGFIPLRAERYDLAIPETELELTPVQRMLDALNSRRFAQEVAQLCSYDTTRMGEELARIGC